MAKVNIRWQSVVWPVSEQRTSSWDFANLKFVKHSLKIDKNFSKN